MTNCEKILDTLEEIEAMGVSDNSVENFLRVLAEDLNKKEKSELFISYDQFNDEIIRAKELGIIISSSGGVRFRDENFHRYYFFFKRCKNLASTSKDFWIAFFETLKSKFYGGNERETIDWYLLLLDRVFQVDIIYMFSTISDDLFWKFYIEFCDVFPYLGIIKINSIVKTLERIYPQTRKDVLGGMINESFMKFVKNYPERGIQLFSTIIESRNEKQFVLLSPIVAGLSETTRNSEAYSILEKSFGLNEVLVQYVIISLGVFRYGDQQELWEKTIGLLDENYNDGNELITSAMAIAYGNLLTQNTDKRIIQKLDIISKIGFDMVQHSIANVLFQLCNLHNEEWYKKCLLNIVDIKSSQFAAISSIEQCLGELLKSDIEYVYTFIEKWIEFHNIESFSSNEKYHIINLFGTLVRELVNNHRDSFELYMTKWFLKNDMRYHFALSNILTQIDMEQALSLNFDEPMIKSINKNGLILLASRIIGYLPTNYVLISSLLFSLLNSHDENTRNIVFDFFSGFLCLNYPDYAEKFLTQKEKEGTQREVNLARQILNFQEEYYREFSEIPYYKELRLPRSFYWELEKWNIYYNNQIREKAEEKSVLAQIFPKKNVKGGAMVHIWNSHKKGYSCSSGGIPMKEISTTVCIPRGANFDPTGFDIKGMIFRTRGIKNEADY